MIDKFYKPFHKKVEDSLENAERSKGERILGKDPKTGKTILVKIGRFGPVAQKGETGEDEKPEFAGIRKDQHLETITLEEVLELFKLPRNIGKYEKEDITVSIGRFGPYVRHKSKFYSLKKDVDDPFTVEKDRAIEIIEEKRKSDREKLIKEFEENSEVKILKGRWGPYIKYNKKNFKIPKDYKPEDMKLEDCMNLIGSSSKTIKKTIKKTKKTIKKTKKK